RAHGAKDRTGLLALGDSNTEPLLHEHGDLQGVEGVEADSPVAEQWSVVTQSCGISIQIELGYEERLDFAGEVRTWHGLRIAAQRRKRATRNKASVVPTTTRRPVFQHVGPT